MRKQRPEKGCAPSNLHHHPAIHAPAFGNQPSHKATARREATVCRGSHHHSAIDTHDLASDVARLGGREKGNRAGDIFGRAGFA